MDELKILKEIKRYENAGFVHKSDLVVRETSLTIYINGKRLLSIACLPEYAVELGLGFLYSEGIIISKREIASYEYSIEGDALNFTLDIPASRIVHFLESGEKTSGCGSSLSAGINGQRSDFPPAAIYSHQLLSQMREFQRKSLLFQETGGVHSAALANKDGIFFHADDIGRHNAVDKVAGMVLQQGGNLGDYYLLCSGRISSEIVKKGIRLGIPVIVSQSAVTSEAIRLGWDYKIFLIGFCRGRRFNIYTGFEEDIFQA